MQEVENFLCRSWVRPNLLLSYQPLGGYATISIKSFSVTPNYFTTPFMLWTN